MKISDNDLKKLRAKGSIMRLSPTKKLPDLGRDIQHLMNLILRRYGKNPRDHKINLQTGEIMEK